MMKKTILALLLAAAAFVCPTTISAKQTLEEATDSIQNIYKQAKAGDTDAQVTVGTWYYQGRHVDRNYGTAAQWWAKAAKAGNNKAIGYLGLCYQGGRGVERDSLRAAGLYTRSLKDGNKELMKSLIESADKGNVFSMVFVAQCYQKEIGVKKDIYKASDYYEKASKKGSVDANRELGLMLLNNKQAVDAAKYFKMGADKGDLSSTFYYGKLLSEGKGIAKDPTRGMIYMQKAADAGFANAQLYLGRAFYEGNGVRKSPETGYSWMLKAARNGNSNAMYQTAMKEVAGDGTNLDYEQATLWFGKAVANHHGKAFAKAFKPDGDLYESPYLTFLQAKEAIATSKFDIALKKAKELQKSKTAAISTTGTSLEGIILCHKDYAKRNLKKGVKLLEKASEKDNAMAKYLLAGMYESGTGVEKDLARTTELLTASARLGNTQAMSYLGDMLYEGRGVKQDYTKAVECYRNAGPLLTESAAKHLAACYENGYGGLKADKAKAKEILKADHSSTFDLLVKLLP